MGASCFVLTFKICFGADDINLLPIDPLLLFNIPVHFRKGASWFPWKTMSFLLLVGTAAIINLDVQQNGSFSRSHGGIFLKDIGTNRAGDPANF